MHRPQGRPAPGDYHPAGMSEPAATGEPTGEPALRRLLRPPTWPSWPATLVLTLLVMAPGYVAFVRLAGTTWYPTGDMAQAELHVRGLWSHPPLVGAAGRIQSDTGVQGSHPGPSLWFAMYPLYALFGRTSLGLMAGALSVHTVAVLVTLRLARRLGGAGLMLAVAVALSFITRSSGPAFFVDPWNPWLAVLPFAVFVLAVWATLAHSPWWLVVATAAGIHCVHCHVGYLVLVGGIGGLSVAALVVRAVRSRQLRSLAAPVGWAALAAVVMWLPPLIDQLTREPGNLSILYQHFSSPSESFLPRSTAARIVASELSVLGPWLTGPALIERNPLGVAVTLALWGTAVVVAWRRRDQVALWLHATLGVGVVLGTVSVLRIFGSYQEYTIRWFWILTAIVLVGSLWTLWRAVSAGRRAALGPPLALAASGVLVAVTALGVVQFAQRAELTGESDSQLVGALYDDVEAGLDPAARYLLRWHDPVGLGAVPFGLVLQLERDGYRPGVDQEFAAAALPNRVLPEDHADGLLWVVLGRRIDDFRADPAFTELAFADLRSDAERARYGELYDFLVRRFTELGRPELADALDAQYGNAGLLFIVPPLPADIAAAVSEIVDLRLPAAVFLAAPGTPPPPE